MNLYKPETRPMWEIEALTAHESVPGHHLQIALAYELTGLPRVPPQRRVTRPSSKAGRCTARSFGYDLGLYKDDFSKMGQLNYDMWRAVRLVVDTGMHSFKWTRDQAIYFFKQNTGKSELDINNEVDRYISWPGQALAYKLGQLRIQALRAEAEKALGDRVRHPRIPRQAPRQRRTALVGARNGNARLDRGAERTPVIVDLAPHQAFSSRSSSASMARSSRALRVSAAARWRLACSSMFARNVVALLEQIQLEARPAPRRGWPRRSDAATAPAVRRARIRPRRRSSEIPGE